jgi:hypothetical protein
MRRIYDSGALHRDKDDPFTPAAADDSRSRSAFDWERVSHAFMPRSVRRRAVSVSVETDRDVYETEDRVTFRVGMENKLPFPVTLKTRSPLLWSWDVDGLEKASRVTEADPPDRQSLLTFERSERKEFERTWLLSIRDTEREWIPVGPGEYTLSAWINVAPADREGLVGETTVTVRS